MRAWILGVSCVPMGITALSAPALAQSTSPVLQGEIPFEYSRGRNISVMERERPESQAQGIPSGGFTLLPRLNVTTGYIDNVYSLPEKTGDAVVDINPEVRINSNWSRNRLNATVGGNFRRFFDETLKNENGWYGRLGGRYEIGLESAIEVTARAEKLYESRFSPSTTIDVQSSVPYRTNQLRVVAENRRGRLRLAAAGSFENYDFQPVIDSAGVSLPQDNRDREIWTGSALAEYGLSPDTSVFAQITYEDTNYGTELSPGIDNRDSKTVRGVVGTSLDLSALVRGRIGIGYVVRDYQSPLYRNIKGLAAEAELEYFLSPITTLGFSLRRRIDDASIPDSSGYISTAGGVRIDHELLRNLILMGRVNYEVGDYRGIDSHVNVFRISGGARYLMTRRVSLRLDGGYGERSNSGVPTGPEFNETRGSLTLALQL